MTTRAASLCSCSSSLADIRRAVHEALGVPVDHEIADADLAEAIRHLGEIARQAMRLVEAR